MSKILKCLLLLFTASIFLIKPSVVHAACSFTVNPTYVPPYFKGEITLTSPGCFTSTPTKYTVLAYPLSLKSIRKAVDSWKYLFLGRNGERPQNQDANSLTTILSPGNFVWVKEQFNNQDWVIVVCLVDSNSADNLKKCEQTENLLGSGKIYIGENPPGTAPSDLPIIDQTAQKTCTFQIGDPVHINAINNVDQNEQYGWWRYPEDGKIRDFKSGEFQIINQDARQAKADIQTDQKTFDTGIQRICVDLKDEGTERAQDTHYYNCLFVYLSAGPPLQLSCQQLAQAGIQGCIKTASKDAADRCSSAGGLEIPGCGDNTDPKGAGIATAIGCIHTNPAELVKDLMTWVLGISGGLAFLMMLLGAFQMLTSAGNPDTLRAGRERLTSAVIGLLFVIFAVLLLQIIGVGILNIPGFK